MEDQHKLTFIIDVGIWKIYFTHDQSMEKRTINADQLFYTWSEYGKTLGGQWLNEFLNGLLTCLLIGKGTQQRKTRKMVILISVHHVLHQTWSDEDSIRFLGREHSNMLMAKISKYLNENQLSLVNANYAEMSVTVSINSQSQYWIQGKLHHFILHFMSQIIMEGIKYRKLKIK